MSIVVLTGKDCAFFSCFFSVFFLTVFVVVVCVCWFTFFFFFFMFVIHHLYSNKSKTVIFYKHMSAMSQGNPQSVNVSKLVFYAPLTSTVISGRLCKRTSYNLKKLTKVMYSAGLCLIT